MSSHPVTPTDHVKKAKTRRRKVDISNVGVKFKTGQ